MAWFYLFVAGVLEIVWAVAMKQSEGFTRLSPALVTFAAMIASFGFLAAAMRHLPLGTAYGIWTGIGTLGAFIVGIVVLGEPATTMRLSAAAFILVGIVMLKASAV